jgi:hypothetical protein
MEIKIKYLIINTIAMSDKLKDSDKEASMLIESSAGLNSTVDEYSQAKMSFRFLKKLVENWAMDVKLNENEISDRCLRNIHKWIVDEDNIFYDPYLARMLTKLMKIVLGLLVKSFKDLGVEIVFASFEKLIINT